MGRRTGSIPKTSTMQLLKFGNGQVIWHHTLYCGCDYLSMLEFKSIRVSKRSPTSIWTKYLSLYLNHYWFIINKPRRISLGKNSFKTSNFLENVMKTAYYSDVTWTSWRLKSPVTRLFVQQLTQANFEGKIKVLHITGALRGKSTGGFPTQRASNV